MSRSLIPTSFLDTTPRQWVSGLVGLVPRQGFYLLSLLLHGSLFFIMPLKSINSLHTENAFIKSSVMEISVVSTAKPGEYAEVKNGSEEFLISKKKRAKKSDEEKLKDLLKNLKSDKNISWDKKAQSQPFKFHLASKQLKIGNTMTMSQVLMSMKNINQDKDNEELKKEDQNRLLKMIEAHQSSFRKCYETSKLQDQNISGQVSINLHNTGSLNSSDIQFQGQGTAESRNNLKACLENESRYIPIQQIKSGITIKFGLVFL